MRRNDGRETWHRLLEWDKGQAPAERLAAVVLLSDGDGFRNVDPSIRRQRWVERLDFS